MKAFRWLILLSLVLGVLAGSLYPAAAARAPVGKTYFVISLGIATDQAEIYQSNVACVTFTRNRVCDLDGDCTGTWTRMADPERPRQRWEIEYRFEVVDDETGESVTIEGRGRVDSRGSRSAIGGVARGRRDDTGSELNMALAGRAVGIERCRQLVAERRGAD